jgi:hypothetical protein
MTRRANGIALGLSRDQPFCLANAGSSQMNHRSITNLDVPIPFLCEVASKRSQPISVIGEPSLIENFVQSTRLLRGPAASLINGDQHLIGEVSVADHFIAPTNFSNK